MGSKGKSRFKVPRGPAPRQQLEQLQNQMMQAQNNLAEAVVTASAGGGAVVIEMTGAQELRSITIKPEVVDPEDVEMLQDLIMPRSRRPWTSRVSWRVNAGLPRGWICQVFLDVATPKAVSRLIEAFSRLPGIGPKTASRLAYHLSGRPRGRAVALQALRNSTNTPPSVPFAATSANRPRTSVPTTPRPRHGLW